MKNIVFLFTYLLLSAPLQAQTNPIDALIDKYSDREGFTLVSFSGKMFSMIASMEDKSSGTNSDDFIHNIRSIKILSVEDSTLNKTMNFYTELSKNLDLSSYEELMVIKEGKDMTKFLIKHNGERISELLVITGGPNGNSIISIRGNMSQKNISDLSKMDGLETLDKLNKKGK